MASEVDVTFPPTGEKVSKAEARAQNLIINNEISELQKQVRLPGQLAFGVVSFDGAD